MALAETVRRGGRTPVITLLTDARANIARDGTGGRPRAEAEALEAARRCAPSGVRDAAGRYLAAAQPVCPPPGRRRCTRTTCRCPTPMPPRCPGRCGPPPRRERAAELGAGRPRLAEPRVQPLRRRRRPALACAGHGRGPGGAADPRHRRLDPFLPRAGAAAGAAFHRGRAGPAGPRLHRHARRRRPAITLPGRRARASPRCCAYWRCSRCSPSAIPPARRSPSAWRWTVPSHPSPWSA